MYNIRRNFAFRIISVILVVAFLNLDIAWAYPSNDLNSHTLGVQTVNSPINLEESVVSGGIDAMQLALSAGSIGNYLLQDGELSDKHKQLLLGALEYVMSSEIPASLRSGISLEHVHTAESIEKEKPGELKKVLEALGLNDAIPDKGVVFIPCTAKSSSGEEIELMLVVARREKISDKNVELYKWEVFEDFVVNIIPKTIPAPSKEDLLGGRSEESQETEQKEDETTDKEPAIPGVEITDKAKESDARIKWQIENMQSKAVGVAHARAYDQDRIKRVYKRAGEGIFDEEAIEFFKNVLRPSYHWRGYKDRIYYMRFLKDLALSGRLGEEGVESVIEILTSMLDAENEPEYDSRYAAANFLWELKALPMDKVEKKTLDRWGITKKEEDLLAERQDLVDEEDLLTAKSDSHSSSDGAYGEEFQNLLASMNEHALENTFERAATNIYEELLKKPGHFLLWAIQIYLGDNPREILPKIIMIVQVMHDEVDGETREKIYEAYSPILNQLNNLQNNLVLPGLNDFASISEQKIISTVSKVLSVREQHLATIDRAIHDVTKIAPDLEIAQDILKFYRKRVVEFFDELASRAEEVGLTKQVKVEPVSIEDKVKTLVHKAAMTAAFSEQEKVASQLKAMASEYQGTVLNVLIKMTKEENESHQKVRLSAIENLRNLALRGALNEKQMGEIIKTLIEAVSFHNESVPNNRLMAATYLTKILKENSIVLTPSEMLPLTNIHGQETEHMVRGGIFGVIQRSRINELKDGIRREFYKEDYDVPISLLEEWNIAKKEIQEEDKPSSGQDGNVLVEVLSAATVGFSAYIVGINVLLPAAISMVAVLAVGLITLLTYRSLRNEDIFWPTGFLAYAVGANVPLSVAISAVAVLSVVLIVLFTYRKTRDKANNLWVDARERVEEVQKAAKADPYRGDYDFPAVKVEVAVITGIFAFLVGSVVSPVTSFIMAAVLTGFLLNSLYYSFWFRGRTDYDDDEALRDEREVIQRHSDVIDSVVERLKDNKEITRNDILKELKTLGFLQPEWQEYNSDVNLVNAVVELIFDGILKEKGKKAQKEKEQERTEAPALNEIRGRSVPAIVSITVVLAALIFTGCATTAQKVRALREKSSKASISDRQLDVEKYAKSEATAEEKDKDKDRKVPTVDELPTIGELQDVEGELYNAERELKQHKKYGKKDMSARKYKSELKKLTKKIEKLREKLKKMYEPIEIFVTERTDEIAEAKAKAEADSKDIAMGKLKVEEGSVRVMHIGDGRTADANVVTKVAPDKRGMEYSYLPLHNHSIRIRGMVLGGVEIGVPVIVRFQGIDYETTLKMGDEGYEDALRTMMDLHDEAVKQAEESNDKELETIKRIRDNFKARAERILEGISEKEAARKKAKEAEEKGIETQGVSTLTEAGLGSFVKRIRRDVISSSAGKANIMSTWHLEIYDENLGKIVELLKTGKVDGEAPDANVKKLVQGLMKDLKDLEKLMRKMQATEEEGKKVLESIRRRIAEAIELLKNPKKAQAEEGISEKEAARKKAKEAEEKGIETQGVSTLTEAGLGSFVKRIRRDVISSSAGKANIMSTWHLEIYDENLGKIVELLKTGKVDGEAPDANVKKLVQGLMKDLKDLEKLMRKMQATEEEGKKVLESIRRRIAEAIELLKNPKKAQAEETKKTTKKERTEQKPSQAKKIYAPGNMENILFKALEEQVKRGSKIDPSFKALCRQANPKRYEKVMSAAKPDASIETPAETEKPEEKTLSAPDAKEKIEKPSEDDSSKETPADGASIPLEGGKLAMAAAAVVAASGKGKDNTPLFELVKGEVNNKRDKLVEAANVIKAYLEKEGKIFKGTKKISSENSTSHIVTRVEELLDTVMGTYNISIEDMDNVEKTVIPEEIKEEVKYVYENLYRLDIERIIASIITLARQAKGQDGTKIIAIEEIASWMPGYDKNDKSQRHKMLLSLLIREIEDLQDLFDRIGLDNVVLMHSASENLASDILNKMDEKNAKMEDVVVLGSNNTLMNSDAFQALREPASGERPLLACIDSSELVDFYKKNEKLLKDQSYGKQLYVPISDMLCIALELANGKRINDSPVSFTYDEETRMVVFLPKPEAVDYSKLIHRYKAKLQVRRSL